MVSTAQAHYSKLETIIHSDENGKNGTDSQPYYVGLLNSFGLSPRQKQVFVLKMQLFSEQEISEILGCAAKTVNTHYYIAKKRLEDKLNGSSMDSMMAEMKAYHWNLEAVLGYQFRELNSQIMPEIEVFELIQKLKLTPKRKEVLLFTNQGFSNKEICGLLNISPKSYETRRFYINQLVHSVYNGDLRIFYRGFRKVDSEKLKEILFSPQT